MRKLLPNVFAVRRVDDDRWVVFTLDDDPFMPPQHCVAVLSEAIPQPPTTRRRLIPLRASIGAIHHARPRRR